jgi:hypothetical protein
MLALHVLSPREKEYCDAYYPAAYHQSVCSYSSRHNSIPYLYSAEIHDLYSAVFHAAAILKLHAKTLEPNMISR